MAVWGIFGSDIKCALWNTAVSLTIQVGCAGIAFAVNRCYRAAFTLFSKPTPDHTLRFRQLGFVIGIGAAIATCIYLPHSRFALAANASTSTMLKLGIIQTVTGLIFDYTHPTHIALLMTVAGSGAALAGRYTSYALILVGTWGALFGVAEH